LPRVRNRKPVGGQAQERSPIHYERKRRKQKTREGGKTQRRENRESSRPIVKIKEREVLGGKYSGERRSEKLEKIKTRKREKKRVTS